MNDTKINELLGAVGIAPILPRTTLSNGEVVKGIKLDSHTFKAKKQLKGVPWESNLNNANDEVELFLKQKLEELTWSSEYYEHFLPDIENLINFGLTNGLLTEGNISLFLNSTTDKLLRLRNNGQQVPMTPGILLSDFTTAVAEISNEIKNAIEYVVHLLIKAGLKTDFSKVTDTWVVDRARRMKLLNKNDNDAIAKLYDKKSRIMAYYKGQADRFKAGDSPLADAFAFALLWREVMYSQSSRAKRQDDEAFEHEKVLFQTKTGLNPNYNPAILDKIRAITPKYQYTKLASVLNLFPTGALQFLDLMENGKITQYLKVPQNISGFFVCENINEEVIREIKFLQGKTVILKDSVVLGTKLQLATEDFSQDGYATSSPRKKMVAEGYPQTTIDSVCAKEYARGGKAFVGGYQLATIVYVETKRNDGKLFKGGVRLWLQDVKLLSEETLHLALNNL